MTGRGCQELGGRGGVVEEMKSGKTSQTSLLDTGCGGAMPAAGWTLPPRSSGLLRYIYLIRRLIAYSYML